MAKNKAFRRIFSWHEIIMISCAETAWEQTCLLFVREAVGGDCSQGEDEVEQMSV